LGVFTPSVLLAVARRTGRLDVDVATVPVASSPAQFRALLDDDLQVALTSPDNVLAHRFGANPADVRIVSAVERGMGLGLYGRPGLSLRGATLGVDVPTSGFALAMYALAESLGFGRDDYRLVTLGSTPRRLAALLAGECDATMLGAGNELLAERAGFVALARVSEVCHPYLGSVLAVAGDDHLGPVSDLAESLRHTAADVLAGRLDQAVTEAARSELDLDDELAARYLDRLRSPADGLVADCSVDLAALGTIVRLRQRYLSEAGTLDTALEPASGLLAGRTDAR
jgi:ABC-type nitrate/sulfonate/bicarbonate transport system substrate-binding protein